jgi:hypothetical protein
MTAALREDIARHKAALLTTLRAAGTDTGGATRPPVLKVPRSGPLRASLAQQRLWFLERLQPGRATFNVPMTWRDVRINLVRPQFRPDSQRTVAAADAGADQHVRETRIVLIPLGSELLDGNPGLLGAHTFGVELARQFALRVLAPHQQSERDLIRIPGLAGLVGTHGFTARAWHWT